MVNVLEAKTEKDFRPPKVTDKRSKPWSNTDLG